MMIKTEKMRRLFTSARHLLTDAKIFIQRSMSYVAILNSGMILFLMLSRLENYGFNINLTKWFIPIFLMTICCMVAVGFLDTRLGFFAEEKKQMHRRDPHEREIVQRLARIEKALQQRKL